MYPMRPDSHRSYEFVSPPPPARQSMRYINSVVSSYSARTHAARARQVTQPGAKRGPPSDSVRPRRPRQSCARPPPPLRRASGIDCNKGACTATPLLRLPTGWERSPKIGSLRADPCRRRFPNSTLHQRDPRSALFEGYNGGGGGGDATRRQFTPSPGVGGGYGYGVYPGSNGNSGHLGIESRGYRPATPNSRYATSPFPRTCLRSRASSMSRRRC